MRRKGVVKGYKGNKRRLTLKNKCRGCQIHIYVTEHAIKRYQERFKKSKSV